MLIDAIEIHQVDGGEIRKRDQSYADGGHHYVFPFLDEPDVVIEEGIHGEDLVAIMVHELAERCMMKFLHLSYEEAHRIANTCEEAVRLRIGKDDGKTRSAE